MKYVHWTNTERRKLIDIHQSGCPTRSDLAELFPRHPIKSILATAWELGIHRNVSQWRWLKIAHQHFERREAGLLA